MDTHHLIASLFGVLLSVVLLSALWTRLKLRRLQALADRLDQGRVVGTSWFGGLNGVKVRGKLHGHAAEVCYTQISYGSQQSSRTITTLLARVKVSDPVVRKLSIERPGMVKKLGRFLGLVRDVKTGNERLDDKYILNGRPRALGQLLSDPEAERALDTLLSDYGFGKLRLNRKWLVVEQETASTNPSWLKSVLDRLVLIAKLCDRKKIQVKALGDKVHFAWTGGGEDAICPFCRAGIDVEALALAACEKCDTVHHRPCLEEAGGCVVFGCGGKRTSRERTRNS